MKRYYVTVRDAGRTGFLVGPFDNHDDALAMVRPAQDKAIELQPLAHFYAYGTTGVTLDDDAKWPEGALNSFFPIPAHPLDRAIAEQATYYSQPQVEYAKRSMHLAELQERAEAEGL